VGEAELPSQVSMATGAMSFPERISRIGPAQKQMLAAVAGVTGALLLAATIGLVAVLVRKPAPVAAGSGATAASAEVVALPAVAETASAPPPIERGVITGVVPSTPASSTVSAIDPPKPVEPHVERVPDKPRTRATAPATTTKPKKNDDGF
jgi:hypothetical protein